MAATNAGAPIKPKKRPIRFRDELIPVRVHVSSSPLGPSRHARGIAAGRGAQRMAGVEDARRSPPRHGTRFANPRTAESESQLAARDAGAAPLKSAAISGVVAWVAAVVGCGARTGLSLTKSRGTTAHRPPAAMQRRGQRRRRNPHPDALSSGATVSLRRRRRRGPWRPAYMSLGTSGVVRRRWLVRRSIAAKCSDGATYHVVCSCPAARCTCSE